VTPAHHCHPERSEGPATGALPVSVIGELWTIEDLYDEVIRVAARSAQGPSASRLFHARAV